MPALSRTKTLTIPDLVLLSLLAERPMHGYDAHVQLERRMVRDWAGVSRPQVYYSLDKLARLELVRATETDTPFLGPERRVFATTARGRAALAEALEREDWTNQQARPSFLTWLALSWQTRPGVFPKQLNRRRTFLEKELKRKQETLHAVRKEVGHRFHEAVWMLSLTIGQLQTELRWLRKITKEFHRRAPAKHSQYVGGNL